MATDNKSSRLSINNEMAQLDRKNRKFYDELDEQERKKFSSFLMLKWGSAVNGNEDLQAYYLRAMNERVNPHFFELSRHPKLQWLLCTTVSPGMGVQKHWYPSTNAKRKTNPIIKFLMSIRPQDKIDDLEVLAQINDKRDFENLARQHGWTDEEIKKFFS